MLCKSLTSSFSLMLQYIVENKCKKDKEIYSAVIKKNQQTTHHSFNKAITLLYQHLLCPTKQERIAQLYSKITLMNSSIKKRQFKTSI